MVSTNTYEEIITVYAIIEDGGRQYKVQPGEVLNVELRDLAEDQAEVQFDRVLLCSDDQTTVIGKPTIAGATVTGKILTQTTGPKLFPTSFRRRKDSQRRMGHRQKYLAVEITDIKQG